MQTPLKAGVEYALLFFSIMVGKIDDGVIVAPFKYYDLKISDEALKKMEITLCPKITDENKKMVEQMVYNLNPSAKIHESIYQDKNR